MDDSNVFDDTFFAILKDSKTLPNFLNKLFGFLRRRTDFYCISSAPNSIGLPPGLAELMVRQTFLKWKPPETAENNCSSSAPEIDLPEPVLETEVEICTGDITSNITKSSETEVLNFSASDSYNGAIYENYSWSQTITDVDIIVKVAENVTIKNISVIILPNKISVKIVNPEKVLLDGEFYSKCKHTDAIWSLDKKQVNIHLDKASEQWWDCLVQSEPRLDLTKIDCSRSFYELSDEAQAKIEEITWNQERRRLGLPTSEELLLEDKLKKSWNLEGSPFKGPFDPRSVTLN